MLVKQQQLSVFFLYWKIIKLVKYTMVLQQWTDGSRARKRYYNYLLLQLVLNFPMRQAVARDIALSL
jgi:hypothetical protein